jgi:S1-C subfamily serine protease
MCGQREASLAKDMSSWRTPAALIVTVRLATYVMDLGINMAVRHHDWPHSWNGRFNVVLLAGKRLLPKYSAGRLLSHMSPARFPRRSSQIHPFLDVLRRAALLLLLCLTTFTLAPAVYAQSTTSRGTVYCYDEVRESVRVTQAGQCAGRVISAAEAEHIQTGRDARTQRIVGGRARADGANSAPRIGRRGSGFFIDRDGLLLTNRHVVDQCRAISVTTADRTVPAHLRAVAQSADIALLTADRITTSFARFSSTPDATSEALLIVGFPQGSPTPGVATLSFASRGIVDLRARQPLYTIAGTVQPGNSGSPVLDQAGNVVGMVAARIIARRMLPEQPQSFVGAIPISTIIEFLVLHHVRFETAPAAEEWTNPELLSRARQFVARINCTL